MRPKTIRFEKLKADLLKEHDKPEHTALEQLREYLNNIRKENIEAKNAISEPEIKEIFVNNIDIIDCLIPLINSAFAEGLSEEEMINKAKSSPFWYDDFLAGMKEANNQLTERKI